MQWNPQRSEYRLDPRDSTDHSRLHEGGHCLANLVFVGSPGHVEMDHSGLEAVCRAVRKADLQLDASPGALALHRACVNLAGWCAEKIGLGQPRPGGSDEDFEEVERAIQEAREVNFLIDRKGIEVTVNFLLKLHWPSVVAAAACVRPSHITTSDELSKAMLRVDETGMLELFTKTPILGPNWRGSWNAVRNAAGRDFAHAYINARH